MEVEVVSSGECVEGLQSSCPRASQWVAGVLLRS